MHKDFQRVCKTAREILIEMGFENNVLLDEYFQYLNCHITNIELSRIIMNYYYWIYFRKPEEYVCEMEESLLEIFKDGEELYYYFLNYIKDIFTEESGFESMYTYSLERYPCMHRIRNKYNNNLKRNHGKFVFVNSEYIYL